MATRNFTFGGGTDPNEIDVIDLVALMLLPIASSMIFDVFSLDINIFGGYNFTEPIWTVAGIDISAALLIVVFSVIWIVVTNIMNEETDLKGAEAGVAVTAIALPLLYVLVPAVESLVHWHDVMQLFAVLYVAAASVYVSYVG